MVASPYTASPVFKDEPAWSRSGTRETMRLRAPREVTKSLQPSEQMPEVFCPYQEFSNFLS